MLTYPQESIDLSIGELPKRSGTSKAAMIRFCKPLRFDGYREFLMKLACDLSSNSNEENAYTDIQVGDNLETIIRNVSHNNKKPTTDSLLVLDNKELKKAVEAIHKAVCVDFYGTGASRIIAIAAQQKFMRINRYSMTYADSHLQATAAANLSEKDVAIFISYSGETRDIIETMRIARQTGTTTISITTYGSNTLSEKADMNLFISSPETTMRRGANGSRIAQLNIIDILFSAVCSIEYSEIKKHLDRTRKVRTIKKFSR